MAIRSTSGAINNLVQSQIASLSTQMADAQEQALTGQRINAPSDDASAIGTVYRLREQVADQDVYMTNATNAQTYLGSAEQAMSTASDIMSRLRELATQMASETYSDEDRAAAAEEVEQLQSQLVDVANSNVGGRYIFSGTTYDQAAYDDSGTYQGSDGEPSTQVGDSTWAQTGFAGSEIFDDAFAAIDELLTALNSDDSDGITAALGSLEDADATITSAWSSVGYEMNMIDDAMTSAEAVATQLSESLSALVDVDLAAAYTRLAELQTSYEATLQISSQTLSTSLFDYLR